MDVSNSRIRNASFVAGLVTCLGLCGCSLSRDHLLDRPTQMEQRVSVDDLEDENSGFEAVDPKADRRSSQTGSRTLNDPRRKLAEWRDKQAENQQSIPLSRTDSDEIQENLDEVDTYSETARTADSSNNSSSPFDQALSHRGRTGSRNSTLGFANDASGESNSSEIIENPFED